MDAGDVSWASETQRLYWSYLARLPLETDAPTSAKRLRTDEFAIAVGRLDELKARWEEDKAHRDALSEICGRLLLDPAREVPIGEAEGPPG